MTEETEPKDNLPEGEERKKAKAEPWELSDEELLEEAMTNFALCEEADQENREAALNDLKFWRLGEQWPDWAKTSREDDNRPCLTINKGPAILRQVVNDARQNKPSIKVHPVDSAADVVTAEVVNDVIRGIEYASNADVAYDTAIEYAASCGMGYIRVLVDYAFDDAFDLDIIIASVANVFSVYGDPYSQNPDGSDWNMAFVTELLKEEDFEAKYPDAEKVDWKADRDEKSKRWFDGEQVRVAEYWRRYEVERTIYLLNNGLILSEKDYLERSTVLTAGGIKVAKRRKAKSHKVMQFILTADEVLERNEWQGRFIPIIPVFGEEINVEGKRIRKSLLRDATDAQMMFNMWRSSSAEMVALAPKAPFVGPKGAFKTDAAKWTTANTKSHPYLEYDGNVPPQRQPFAGVPAGIMQEAMLAADDIKAITGMYDASLGARSNETSGRAIMARQREGDVSTFHIIDNGNRAIKQCGRVVLDLIPHVINGPRVMRARGEDGKERSVPVNQEYQAGQDEAGKAIMALHDLTSGKYDLTVSAGPSFTTRRQEVAAEMTEMMRSFPQSVPIVGPRVMKLMDLPEADKMADELKALAGGGDKGPAQPTPEQQLKNKELDFKNKELDFKNKKLDADAATSAAEHQQKMAEINLQTVQANLEMLRERNKAVGALPMLPNIPTAPTA